LTTNSWPRCTPYLQQQSQSVLGSVTQVCLKRSSMCLITYCNVKTGVQACRECCGGHGYSTCNRLGLLLADNQPTLTFEGDNPVLIQQAAKWILSIYQRKMTGKKTSTPLQSASFVEALDSLITSKVSTSDGRAFDLMSLKFIN